MAMLLFNHRGWEVVTNAWTVAAKPGRQVEICYQWGTQISYQGATGVCRVTLNMTMAEFLPLLEVEGIVDLRGYG